MKTIKELESYYNDLISKRNFSFKIELGEELNDRYRVTQALRRAHEIMQFVFKNDDMWVRLTLWDVDLLDTYKNLISCGYVFENSDTILKVKPAIGIDNMEEDEVYYVNYKKFDFEKIKPILNSIFSYELAIEPSANVSAVFFNFGDPSTLINPYDDRGLDVISLDSSNYKELKTQFNKWICKE